MDIETPAWGDLWLSESFIIECLGEGVTESLSVGNHIVKGSFTLFNQLVVLLDLAFPGLHIQMHLLLLSLQLHDLLV